MRKIKWVFVIITLVVFGATSQVYADVYAKGHYRNGMYVKPYYRSNPDGIFSNNFSTYGNINPYTGKIGTKHYPDYNPFYNYLFTPFAFSDIGNNFLYNSNSLQDDSSSADSSTTSTYTTTDTANTTTDETSNTDLSTIQDAATTTDTTTPTDTETDSTTDTTASSDQSDNINVTSNYIDAYDTPDQIEAKNMLVDYFNNINTRSYIPAYNSWDLSWQSRHPYDAFESGYVDVINTIDSMTATKSSNGITLEEDISTTESWEQTDHKYHYVYYVKQEDYTWKLVKGTLNKLW